MCILKMQISNHSFAIVYFITKIKMWNLFLMKCATISFEKYVLILIIEFTTPCDTHVCRH